MPKIIVGIIGLPGSGKETVSKEIEKRIGKNKVFRETFSGPLTRFLRDMGYDEEEIDRPLLQRLGQMLVKHFRPDAVTCGILNLIRKTKKPMIVVDEVRWPSDFEKLKNFTQASAKKKLSGFDPLDNLSQSAVDALKKFLLDMDYARMLISRGMLNSLAENIFKHFGDDFFDDNSEKRDEKTKQTSRVRCLMIFVKASRKTRFKRQKERQQRAGEAELTWKEFLKQDSAPNEQYIPELAEKADFIIDNEEDDPQFKKLKTRIDEFFRKFLGTYYSE